jgi:signal transduction histidine kinase
LIVEEPWQAVVNTQLNTTLIAPLLLIPLLLATLLALWFGGREIIRPLQQLTRQATALGWGDFALIEEPVGGIDEIQRLQSELQSMARRVAQAQSSLRSYAGAVTLGQEEERRRLARELHDDAIQSLVALSQRIQLAQLHADAPPVLDDLQRMTVQIIGDVRRFTQALRPGYLEELGLLPALESLIEEVDKTASVEIAFHVEGPSYRLPPETELALYRIVQEGLSNAIKHAQARYVAVRVVFSAESLTLTIQDDGIGFSVPESPSAFAEQGHFGLLGIHERAELIGASATVESVANVGTVLSITIIRSVESTPEI